MRKKRKRFKIVGQGKCGSPIVCGEFIFAMVGSEGLPFSVVNHILEQRDWGFDVQGFIQAARCSGNYNNPERLYNLLTEDTYNKEVHRQVQFLIKKEYV